MNEDQLSNAEKKLFEGLEREKQPPKNLESKIITQLINEGQIQKTTTMNNYLKWAASIAAAFLFFYGGMYYERSGDAQVVQIEPTKGYMLLLHEDENFQPGDPMAMFEEYGNWMQNTFSRGVKITGQELKNEATLVKGQEQISVDDASRKTTGYFILEASSYEEAIAVAKENPHVKYGGIVEVKPYMVR